MGKNGDGDDNLVFEHELAPGQDDEGVFNDVGQVPGGGVAQR
jgi:hypothetical protein